ncbi:MAG: class I SAM-dependent methyltransferase [Parahaliea sp.]
MDATVTTPSGPGDRAVIAPVPGKEFNEILTELETWYASPVGRYVLELTRSQLAAELDTAFGYHLAQVGGTGHHPLYTDSPIRHRIYVAPVAGGEVGLVAAADELPLASDSVDVLVAHHSLEFCARPHQALREMHRVLTPQGHLFVIGFNPLSLPGLSMALRARLGSPLWRQRQPLLTWRTTDWLRVLGLEVESIDYHYALAPRGGRGLSGAIRRFNQWCADHRLPMGGLYMVHAMKQVSGHIRPPQRTRGARLIGLAVPKPVAAQRPAPARRDRDAAA